MDTSLLGESDGSRQKENVPTQAVKDNTGPPKVKFLLPDSDSASTDSDDVLSVNEIPALSAADEEDHGYFPEGSGPTRPVPIPVLVSRDRRNDDIKKASLEFLNDNIKEWTIGFDLAAFPQIVKSWIPTLRATALPGSYEHLLLLMFDDVKEFNRFQTILREAGVPGAIDPRQNGTLTVHAELSRRNVVGKGRGQGQARSILVPRGQIVQSNQTTDEMYFWRELHIIRRLVAPIRDEHEEIVWITSREQQPDDMIQQGHQPTSPPKGLESPSYKELRLRTSSLHQFRMDCCKGSLEWARFPPSEIELRRRYNHFGKWHGRHKEPVNAPIKNIMPQVQVSSNLAFEFDNAYICMRRDGRILHLLVQIAQWLALARGFTAVHLFCDVARLFSTHGVDIGNKAQVEICKQLTRFELLCDSLNSPLPLNFPASSSVVDQFSPTFIQGVIQANRKMVEALVGLNTLFHRVNVGWRARTRQTLEWQTWGGERVLALKTPRLFFPRATVQVPFAYAGIFSDEELAAHLDTMCS
ncbi:hypothetical protein N7448_002969 [Penicillium atrosanguineum]|nr:hypothetical protein N7448_002969 [Penicillium atrosanguineum]